jgi:hypothetical protein
MKTKLNQPISIGTSPHPVEKQLYLLVLDFVCNGATLQNHRKTN